MSEFLSLTVAGIATYGCVYALTAMGLVVTYATSGVFNFAQGALGMVGAFGFWQFAVHMGVPTWLAFILIVFVLAPLVGALIERTLIRRLEGASLEATLTVTVGLLLLLIAIANIAWNPATTRTIPQFFNGKNVTIANVAVSYHQLIAVGVAVLAAVGLRLFLYRTRAGIATRAVVGDRELAALTGASPNRYAQIGWALGAMMAAASGILIAPLINLDINTLTLIVINGYAAAMVGRLRNLPLTFAGGMILGLLYSYAVGYLPVGNVWSQIVQLTPMVFLFIVILVLPQNRATIARRVTIRAPRIVGLRESLITGAGFVIVAAVVSMALSGNNLATADRAAAIGIIALSLTLLTGYGGQVSLCQLSFAGLGAVMMSKVGGSGGSLLGLLAAVGVTAAAGALVALPSLRLRGLYLALATLAFAYGMDSAFFTSTDIMGVNGSLNVARPHIPGISFKGNQAYFIALCIVFAAVGVGLLALRRSSFGRRLSAMTDSPAACLTLGVDLTKSKLAVFTLSAGLAGLGGALYGGAQTAISANDFPLLLSLTLLLLAVVWGIKTIGGMFLAGLSLALGPVLQSHLHNPREVVSLLVGLAAIGVAQNPNGTFGGNTPLQRLRDRRQRVVDAAPQPAMSVEERLSGAAR